MANLDGFIDAVSKLLMEETLRKNEYFTVLFLSVRSLRKQWQCDKQRSLWSDAANLAKSVDSDQSLHCLRHIQHF